MGPAAAGSEAVRSPAAAAVGADPIRWAAAPAASPPACSRPGPWPCGAASSLVSDGSWRGGAAAAFAPRTEPAAAQPVREGCQTTIPSPLAGYGIHPSCSLFRAEGLGEVGRSPEPQELSAALRRCSP